MKTIKNEAFYNRSLERALQILNTFSNNRRALSLTQLSETLNLSRATVLRLCSTLLKYGFLKHDSQSKKYSLGVKLFELGSIVSCSFSLRKIASPFVSQLQARLGMTVFLGILDHDEVLYIDKRDDPGNPISFTSEVGIRRPPFWGMLGSVLMAFLPDYEIERLLQKNPLIAFTKKSITEKKEYTEWLCKVRNQGFAIDYETAFEGITGISAPIKDFTGKVIGALGVGFISSLVKSNNLNKILKEVIETAMNISRGLGYNETTEK